MLSWLTLAFNLAAYQLKSLFYRVFYLDALDMFMYPMVCCLDII